MHPAPNNQTTAAISHIGVQLLPRDTPLLLASVIVLGLPPAASKVSSVEGSHLKKRMMMRRAMCSSSSVEQSKILATGRRVCANKVCLSRHNRSTLLLVHRVHKFDWKTWITTTMTGKYSSKLPSRRSTGEQRRMPVMSRSS